MNAMRYAGYVKLAKLWERSRDSAITYHRNYYADLVQSMPDATLADVYIDITGQKEIRNRKEMIRLLKDCRDRKVDCILTQTKAYLAANSREFCYLFRYLSDIPNRVDIVTEDEQYHINTIHNSDNQKEALLEMANSYIQFHPDDYIKWKQNIDNAIMAL